MKRRFANTALAFALAALAAMTVMAALPASAIAAKTVHPEGWHGGGHPEGHADGHAAGQPDVPGIGELHIWDGHHHRHHGFLRSTIFSEVAKMLGMSESELAQALKDKTLAEIAAEKGISEKELLNKLKNLYKQKIDEAVKEGRLDKAKAKRLKSDMDEHLRHLIHRKLYEQRHRPVPNPDQLASMLGMTRDELIEEWKQGKSLVEIAEARGISKEELIRKIKEDLTPWIQSLVERKAKKAE